MTATVERHAGLLDRRAVEALTAWVTTIEAWPAGSHRWGQYAERVAGGDVICRTENPSGCHEALRELVDGVLASAASEALDAPARAFKDKLNYKQPGGGGFAAHQDVRAYPGAGAVVSVLVAVDRCTVESGCLLIGRGCVGLLPTDDRGVITQAAAESVAWEPIELDPGDAVCIGGLAPHRSDSNRSAAPRRVLIASYTPASAGYDRERYYAARRTEMVSASARDGRRRISTLADFEGAMVPEVTPATMCTHG